jgi:putative DNA primase/helicase
VAGSAGGDNVINPDHLAMLAASGITPEHAAARGYETITDKRRLAELKIVKDARSHVPGLLVPLLRREAAVWGHQYRPDVPRLLKGKVVKYETPWQQRNGLDIPPGVGPMLGDPEIPLWITEGVKKADCGALHGLCIVGLIGVWNWIGTNSAGGKVALADWRDVALNDGRPVIIAFDGDMARNPSVQIAAHALANYLAIKGAHVEYLWLPDSEDKTGLDDYLVADGHTVEDLLKLVKPTQPPPNNRPKQPRPQGDNGNTSTGNGTVAPALDDAHIGPYVAEHYLAGEFLYSKAFGWMCYDGRRWEQVADGIVAEVVRKAVIDLHFTEARAGATADRLVQISRLFSANRLRSVLWVARNYLSRRGEEFDAHPELLNVHNGVVDLRDGTLHPHDPKLLFTKATMVAYRPGATHPDWDTALTAVSAGEAEWLQVRLGQGLTGHPPPDDILVVLKGSGENGKSTVIDGVRGAAGVEYAIPLPDRVLLARPGDHPTELMTLRDARLAFMEEFPELGHLNVKRLKDLTGTEWMSARYCGQDTVNWRATHSVFVTTNYLPRVDESDHGTWRRLALVDFPHRYRKPHEAIETQSDLPADPGLRARVRAGEDGQHEAVLAWLIEGAVRWYRNGRTMPEPSAFVLEATSAWRKSADLLLRYLGDNLVFDPDAHVMSADLYEDFTDWLKEHGHAVWTDQNFTARFIQHPELTVNGVEKKPGIRKSRPGLSRRPSRRGWTGNGFQRIPQQYHAWLGIRFRDPDEDPD